MSISAVIRRVIERNGATLGVLMLPSAEFLTLELPWRDNHHDISCIPPGTYPIRVMYSAELGRCVEILNVPDRALIRMHGANIAAQLLGCIAAGSYYGRLGGQPAVLESRLALKHVCDALGNESGTLTVRATPQD